MKLIAPADLYLSRLDLDLTEGDEIEVDDDLGAQLVEQGWSPAGKARPAKRAAKRARKAPAKRAPSSTSAETDTDTDTTGDAGVDTSSATADESEGV